MTQATDPNTIRKELVVEAPQELAWRIFTVGFSSWWPLASHKIGKAPAVDAIIEGKVGGRWYEKGDDGSTCDWGRVLAWEPPTRLLLTWDISAEWQPDPALNTEVEVTFTALAVDRTRVVFEHRKLDRYGERGAQMRAMLESGWPGLLDAFATAARAVANADANAKRR